MQVEYFVIINFTILIFTIPMRLLKPLLLLTFLVAIVTLDAQCQNSAFRTIATEFQKNKLAQDSLRTLLNNYRLELQNDPSKQATLSAKLVTLEEQLYQADAKVAQTTAQLIEMDPQAAKQLLENLKTSGQTTIGSRTLLENPTLRTLLSDRDMALFRSTASVEKQVATLQSSIKSLYSELSEVKQEYDQSMKSTQIDSLLAQSKNIKEQISEEDHQIERLWRPIYDKKIETYLVLADKIGVERQQLERIDEYSRQVRRVEAESSNVVAPNAALFSPQRSLVLKYESILADKLGMGIAKDSISKLISLIPADQTKLPNLEFEHRSLIVYSKVFNDGEYDFQGGTESIPQLEVPRKGIYYTVQIYSLQSKAKSLDTFKNIRPLRVSKNASGMNIYLAGGFRKHAEAQTAINQILKWGYRYNVLMLAWVDGVSTTPLKAKATQEAIEKANAGRFKLEVTTQNSTLISQMRSIVDSFAPNKQITRSQNGSQTVFTILEFDNKTGAIGLAEILKTKDKTEVEIIKID